MTYATTLIGHLLEASPEGFTFPNHTPGPRMINLANDNSHSRVANHNKKKKPQLSPSSRKLNVILYGVDKCRVGKSKIERQAEELEEIVSVLTGLDESLNLGTIKDFYRLGRLGKFKQEFQKPRPILISFIRSPMLSRRCTRRFTYHLMPGLNPI